MGGGWGGREAGAGEALSRLHSKKNITFYENELTNFSQKFLTNLGWGVYMRWNLFFRSGDCGDL